MIHLPHKPRAAHRPLLRAALLLTTLPGGTLPLALARTLATELAGLALLARAGAAARRLGGLLFLGKRHRRNESGDKTQFLHCLDLSAPRGALLFILL